MGTRMVFTAYRLCKRDHPHAYGDKSDTVLTAAQNSGSSPRVWGQEKCTLSAVAIYRIIPTRMGTSNVITPKDFFILGSSPRVWGQVIPFSSVIPHVGIIPTRMGTSAYLSWRKYSSWDHPHAYGDKLRRSALRQSLHGSSPRVWGQAILKLESVLCARIIPTRMGTSQAK